MKKPSSSIINFIEKNHVLALATVDEQGIWCANCFYAFAQDTVSLIILSSVTTRHGQAMLEHGDVSGTICAQPENVLDIVGLQYTAIARKVIDSERDAALALYTRRHPIAKLKTTDCWILEIQALKFTNNAVFFGFKEHWSRFEKHPS